MSIFKSWSTLYFIHSFYDDFYQKISLKLSQFVNENSTILNLWYIYKEFENWMILFIVLFIFLHYLQNKLFYYLYKKFTNRKIWFSEIIETSIITYLIYFINNHEFPFYFFIILVILLRWFAFLLYKRWI